MRITIEIDGEKIAAVPDDAEALRRSLDVAREGYRKEAAAWRARDTRMGAEVERLEAEVKRLRDSMDTNTNFLISSNGTIWHHDTQCPHRRTMPTRRRIVDALWPEAPESARAGMTTLSPVDRVLALIEQGDES